MTAGPTITGFLLSAKLPLALMLYLMAAPYVIVVFVCFALGRLYKRKFAPAAIEIALAGEALAASGDRS